MRKSLKLVFADENGNQKSISIPNPKELQDEEVKNAMDQIILTNAVMTKENVVTKKVKAYNETVTTEEFVIE